MVDTEAPTQTTMLSHFYKLTLTDGTTLVVPTRFRECKHVRDFSKECVSAVSKNTIDIEMNPILHFQECSGDEYDRQARDANVKEVREAIASKKGTKYWKAYKYYEFTNTKGTTVSLLKSKRKYSNREFIEYAVSLGKIPSTVGMRVSAISVVRYKSLTNRK